MNSMITDKYGREIKVGSHAYFEASKSHTTVIYIYAYEGGRFKYVDLKSKCLGTISWDRAKWMFIVTNDFKFTPIFDNDNVFGIMNDLVVGQISTLIIPDHYSFESMGETHWRYNALRKAHESGKYRKLVEPSYAG